MTTHRHLTVEVTPENITEAIPENSANCMVAMAIKSTYPGAKRVHVDLQTIRFTDKDGVRRTYLTPGKAQVALVRFDAGDPVDPFSFRLNDPIHLRSKNKPRGNEPVASGNSTARVNPHGLSPVVTRLGGHAVPASTALGSVTRRKFGIRGLRINQQGQATHMDALHDE